MQVGSKSLGFGFPLQQFLPEKILSDWLEIFADEGNFSLAHKTVGLRLRPVLTSMDPVSNSDLADVIVLRVLPNPPKVRKD